MDISRRGRYRAPYKANKHNTKDLYQREYTLTCENIFVSCVDLHWYCSMCLPSQHQMTIKSPLIKKFIFDFDLLRSLTLHFQIMGWSYFLVIFTRKGKFAYKFLLNMKRRTWKEYLKHIPPAGIQTKLEYNIFILLIPFLNFLYK